MKRGIAFVSVFLFGLGALILSRARRVDAPVTPAPVLHLIADYEHEATRLPASFSRLSDQNEIGIGNRLAEDYDKRFKRATENPGDPVVQSYVEQVGARVAARARRKLPYKFHHIPSLDFVNAFALPGGHVFIGAGLMSLMDSEDELAAVLGHEVEHIDHYHCAERVQAESMLRRIPLGGLAAIPMEVFEAGYSKDQELEADREGTRLAVWAGYSPEGAIRMFEVFGRLCREQALHARSPQEELSQVAIGTLRGYFASHPPASERIAQTKNLIAEEHWENLEAERSLKVAGILKKESRVAQLASPHL